MICAVGAPGVLHRPLDYSRLVRHRWCEMQPLLIGDKGEDHRGGDQNRLAA